MKALLKNGKVIEIIPNEDFCAAKYIDKETSEYIFDDEIEKILKDEPVMSGLAKVRKMINEKLKEYWNAASPMDDKIEYYRKPEVKLLNELNRFVFDEERKGVEVDLEKEMDEYFEKMEVYEHENIFEDHFKAIARHFYELGRNGR